MHDEDEDEVYHDGSTMQFPSREHSQGAESFLRQWGYQLTQRTNKPDWVLLQCFLSFFPQFSDGTLCKV